MTTNQYFNNESYVPTQNLIEDLTVEVIKIHGQDMHYIPREIIREDYLYEEAELSKFEDEYLIEMYIQTVDGWEGQGDLLTKFGLTINDQATFLVAKRRFEEEVPSISRPREGDLIYFPLTKTLLEIKFVEHENPFYQAGKLYVYSLECELYRYRSEDFNTGIEEIDEIEERLQNNNDASVDPYAENDNIETEAAQYLEFDQNDPFGEY